MSITPEDPVPTASYNGDAGAPAAGYPAGAPAAGYPAGYPAGAPAAGYYPAAPAAPAPQQGINGLAIAGLVLAFVATPVGFIVSLIALIQTGRRRQPGRGLAIAGVVVSVLLMAAATVVIAVVLATVGKNVATVADPGCASGKEVIMNTASFSSNPASVQTQLRTAVDGLDAASAKARHDNVRDAMKALADDYNQLLQAVNTGAPPPADLKQKLEADANKIDELCTLGGAGK